MQDKYVGDVGDFGKLALLRAVATGESLGIGWYFTRGAGEINGDGKHTAYLDEPNRFRHLDPDVFDRLGQMRTQTTLQPALRAVASLEQLPLLPEGTRFHRAICPPAGPARKTWTAAMLEALSGSTFIFVDPDNGIAGDDAGHKHASIAELRLLARYGPVLAYHHQTRMRGGAEAEFSALRTKLLVAGFSRVCAVRLRPYSSRFYFLLDGTKEHRRRAVAFCARWGPEAGWFE